MSRPVILLRGRSLPFGKMLTNPSLYPIIISPAFAVVRVKTLCAAWHKTWDREGLAAKPIGGPPVRYFEGGLSPPTFCFTERTLAHRVFHRRQGGGTSA
jgi:hypothetical protein